MPHRPTFATAACAALVVLFTGCSTATPAEPADRADAPGSSAGFSAGVSVQPGSTPEQIGLPAYPGATPLREGKGDQAGASVGAWGGPFGLNLQVLKLRSGDPVDTVARYYREALARLGPVLDCSQGRAADPPPGDKTLLRCGDERPKAGGQLFKLGTRARSRVVALEPMDGGTRISLVRLDIRGD